VERKGQKSITELSQERLPAVLNKAVGNVKLVISTEDAGQILYFRATREKCEIAFRWGKVLTIVMGFFKVFTG
jgi:hypothetical protein